ncbi:MAG: hypothetical protein ABIJ65_02375 [Chloroflexota bacterium]
MNRWLKFFVVILLGLALGLVYGWVVSPLEYLNTTPSTLRYDYRTDYVLMVAEIFNSSQDADQAVRQLAQLGSDPPVEIVIQSLAHGTQLGYASEDLVLIQNLATSLQTWQSGTGGLTP